jgi:hypothetical protein
MCFVAQGPPWGTSLQVSEVRQARKEGLPGDKVMTDSSWEPKGYLREGVRKNGTVLPQPPKDLSEFQVLE